MHPLCNLLQKRWLISGILWLDTRNAWINNRNNPYMLFQTTFRRLRYAIPARQPIAPYIFAIDRRCGRTAGIGRLRRTHRPGIRW